jgi:hypothetical protein
MSVFFKGKVLGSEVDKRVVLLENKVCDYFYLPKYTLTDWRYDTDAKVLMCFILVKELGYSVSSVAREYNINRGYLRKRIIDIEKDIKYDVELNVVISELMSSYKKDFKSAS